MESAGPPPGDEANGVEVTQRPDGAQQRADEIEARQHGEVMCRKRSKLLPPSTLAASQSSVGIAMQPARKMMVQNGSHFQIWVKITEPSARFALSSVGLPQAPDHVVHQTPLAV